LGELRFTIPGDPHGKQRPRMDRKRGRTYTPKQTVAYEKWAAARAVAAMRALGQWARIEGPVELEVHSVKARPKRLGDGPREVAPVKPDWDNVGRAVADALTKARTYRDDNLVVHADVWTWYAASGESPRVEVVVRELDRWGDRRE
jgi:Holliday junction resolvase RusA-like endonuclease